MNTSKKKIKKRFMVSLPTRLGDILESWNRSSINYNEVSGGCGSSEFEFPSEKLRKEAIDIFIKRIAVYETDKEGQLISIQSIAEQK